MKVLRIALANGGGPCFRWTVPRRGNWRGRGFTGRRRDALAKLFTVGYDVADNVMFGSDSSANGYNAKWVKTWRTSLVVRLRLSVWVSTRMATPPGP